MSDSPSPTLEFVLHSVNFLLDDAMRADSESGHDQRENLRLSHAMTIAMFFGVDISTIGPMSVVDAETEI